MVKMTATLSLCVLLSTAAIASAAGFIPTRAAEAHWKALVFKPANLGPYWRGYFSSIGTKMTSCHHARAQGFATYDCIVTNYGGTQLAFAYLFRTGQCSYGYLIGTMDGKRKFNRNFSFCG